MALRDKWRLFAVAALLLALSPMIITANLGLIAVIIAGVAWLALKAIAKHTRVMGIIGITLSVSAPLFLLMLFDALFDVGKCKEILQPLLLFALIALLAASAYSTAKSIRSGLSSADNPMSDLQVKGICDLLVLSMGIVALGYEILPHKLIIQGGHHINGDNVLKVFFGWSLAQMQAAKMTVEYQGAATSSGAADK